jgi:hypothetical protein
MWESQTAFLSDSHTKVSVVTGALPYLVMACIRSSSRGLGPRLPFRRLEAPAELGYASWLGYRSTYPLSDLDHNDQLFISSYLNCFSYYKRLYDLNSLLVS